MKIHGQRIEISEIESKIRDIKGIIGATIIIKNEKGNHKLIAFIINNNKNLNENKIKKVLKKQLPLYMIPTSIVFVEKLLYTPNGKIDKNSLLCLAEENIKELNSSRKMTKTEKELISIIYDISGKRVQADESFFNVGLDSFDIIRLASELANKYSIEITIKEIVNSDRVSELSNIIERKEKKTEIDKNERNEDIKELTKSQQNIFYDYIKDNNSTKYNTPCEVVFNNKTDIEKLITTIKSVINYHQAFKCNIYIDAGEPYLKYNKNLKVDINIIDTTFEHYTVLKNTFVEPFDLLTDTLIRIKIITENNNIHLLFDSHHIIIDGSSIALIIKEIEQIYNSKSNLKGTDKYMSYKPLSINKDNYCSNEIQTHIEEDYKSEINDDNYGKRICKTIDSDIFNKVKNFSNKNGITVNSIFMSALIITLSKYTYEENVNIGTAVTTRNSKNNNMVGMFVDTVPFETHINVDESVINFIMKTNKNIFDMINNCQSSGTEKNSIVYTYQNFKGNTICIEGEKSTIEYLYKGNAKFDITVEILPTNDAIDINIEYNANKYSYDTINKLQLHYINCIKQMIIKEKLKDIDILDKIERKRILSINHNYAPCKYSSIQEIFNSIVNSNSNKIAVVFGQQNLTYGQLEICSNNLAKELINNGVRHGDTVAIIMDKSVEFIICVLAIIKSGGKYLPIDITIPKERIQYMLDNSHSSVILAKKIGNNTFKKNKHVINVNINDIDKCNDTDKYLTGSIDDNCYVMYTSGSTGHPKGVIIRQEGIIELVKDTNYMNVSEEDKVALSGTISFDASVFEMWLSLLNGLTLYIIDKEMLLQQDVFESYIKENNINIMLLTTALFNSFATYKPEMFGKVRYLLTGGDVFSYKSGNEIIKKNKNIKLINAYGPTESTVIATTYIYNIEHNVNVPIGTPINNTNCYMVDIYNNLAPIGTIAQLLIGGPRIMSKYINNREETEKNMKYHPLEKGVVYHTGDLVKLGENLQIFFMRRKDTQIKINGYRIEISEIISNLLAIPGIKEAEVIVNKEKNNEITAYVVADKNVTEPSIISIISKKLPFYMIPNNILILENMPMTMQGKIDKNILANMKVSKVHEIIMASTAEEKMLVDIWKKVLNKQEIGINENFFEIGGDSIAATQFVMECNKANIKYTYKDIYNYPTIKQLTEKSTDIIDEKFNISRFNYDVLLPNIKKYFIRNNVSNAKNILITGATGFLGAHVLANFLDNNDGIAYCLVREKDEGSRERLLNKLHYFFDKKYDKYVDNRMVVINGDLTLNKLGMSEINYKSVIKNIDSIINCAAYVNHFGNLDKFIELNTNTVSNIIDICKKNDKELYHISTLSVCGNMLEGGQVKQNIDYDKIFDENELYFGQKLNNPYVYSKYLAELKIISALEDGLRATIIRVGNLTSRYSDGKFQPNVEQNAFANRIKAFAHMKLIPDSLLEFNVEFTPVDCAADAICQSVFKNSQKMLIMHVYNDKYTNIKTVLKALKTNKINICSIEQKKFNNELKKFMAKKDHAVDGIIIDINENNDIIYTTNITVSAKKTNGYLKTSQFNWPKINSNYLIKYFENLINIGFLESEEKNND